MTKLFVVAGPAASGKSEFARALAKKFNLFWIDLDDDIEERIAANKALIEKIGMEEFLKEQRPIRYKELLDKANKALKSGQSTVISAPFTAEVTSQSNWDSQFSSFTELGIKPILYWIATEPEVRRERMLNRASLRDKEKEISYKFEAITPVVPCISIDGTGDFDSQLGQ